MYPLPEGTVLGTLDIVEVWDYYDAPRLFLARSRSGAFYVGYWADRGADDETWYYIAVSRQRMQAIRSGLVPLRDAFLSAEEGVVVVVTLDVDGGLVTCAPMQAPTTPLDRLPPANDRLKLETRTLPPQPESALRKQARQEKREVMGLSVKPFGSTRNEALIDLVGPTAANFQRLVADTSVWLEERRLTTSRGLAGRVVDASIVARARQRAMAESELVAVGAYGGSFGLTLAAAHNPDLYGRSLLRDSMQVIAALLAARDRDEVLRRRLHHLGAGVGLRFRKLTEKLASRSSGLGVEWASPRGGGYSAFMDANDVRRLADLVSRMSPATSRNLVLRGRLVGANVRTLAFEIHDQDSSSRFMGHASKEASGLLSSARLDVVYGVTLREEVQANELTGEVDRKYYLVGLEKPPSGTPPDQGPR